MDKRLIYEEITSLEKELQEMLSRVTFLKENINEMIEKNVSLELESKHLRERLIEIETQRSADLPSEKQSLSKSRLNLEKLYEEGFHVCNVYYGSRRENHEECAFCLDVIYGERSK